MIVIRRKSIQEFYPASLLLINVLSFFVHLGNPSVLSNQASDGPGHPHTASFQFLQRWQLLVSYFAL